MVAFGHTYKYCRVDFVCSHCTRRHEFRQASKPNLIPRSGNCAGDHKATSWDCPKFSHPKAGFKTAPSAPQLRQKSAPIPVVPGINVARAASTNLIASCSAVPNYLAAPQQQVSLPEAISASQVPASLEVKS